MLKKFKIYSIVCNTCFKSKINLITLLPLQLLLQLPQEKIIFYSGGGGGACKENIQGDLGGKISILGGD